MLAFAAPCALADASPLPYTGHVLGISSYSPRAYRGGDWRDIRRRLCFWPLPDKRRLLPAVFIHGYTSGNEHRGDRGHIRVA